MPTVPVYFTEVEYAKLVQEVEQINQTRPKEKALKVSGYIHDVSVTKA